MYENTGFPRVPCGTVKLKLPLPYHVFLSLGFILRQLQPVSLTPGFPGCQALLIIPLFLQSIQGPGKLCFLLLRKFIKQHQAL